MQNHFFTKKVRNLSPKDPPLLWYDDTSRLIAGIKLDEASLTHGKLLLRGWCLGSSKLALLCNGIEVENEFHFMVRQDVLEAYATTSSFDVGFEIVLGNMPLDSYGLRCYFSKQGKTFPLDFCLDMNIRLPIGENTSFGEAIGHVNGLCNGVWVSGWVKSPGKDAISTKVIVLRNGHAIAQVAFEKFRPGDAEMPDTPHGCHGFRIDLRTISRTEQLFAGDHLLFAVIGRHGNIRLISEQPLILPLYCDFLGHTGYLDGVSDDGFVRGWATQSASSNKELRIYLFIDDFLVGSTLTGTHRRDVEEAGLGGPQCGFHTVLAKDLRILKLRSGAKLWAAFDETGFICLNGGVILTDDSLAGLFNAGVSCIAQSHAFTALNDLLSILTGPGLPVQLAEPRKSDLFVGAMKQQIALGGTAKVQGILEEFTANQSLHQPAIWLELLRCITFLQARQYERIDINRINSAFIDLYHSYLPQWGRRAHAEGLHVVLQRLYWQIAMPHAGGLLSVDSEWHHGLTALLAHWTDKLTGDSSLALDFLEMVRLDRDTESRSRGDRLLSARLNRAAGRNSRTLALLSEMTRPETESWHAFHELAMLFGTMIRNQPELAAVYLPITISYFKKAESLNPQNGVSQREAWKLLKAIFDTSIDRSRRLAQDGEVAAGVNLRRSILHLLTQLSTVINGDSSRPLIGKAPGFTHSTCHHTGKVLFWGSHILFQCYNYRVKQKMDLAEAQGFHTDYLDLADQNHLDWRRRLMGVTILYACRIPATLNEIRIFTYARTLGISIIYDIDDLIFDFSAFPPPFENYAGMIDEDLYHHLALDNPFFEAALKLSDYITVSTQPLLDEVRVHVNAQVGITILPNLLSYEVFFRAQNYPAKYYKNGNDGKRLVIFYGSATKAHKQSFYNIFLPAALVMLARYSQVDLHLVGYFERLPETLVSAGRIKRQEPTSDYLGYLQLVRQADINVAVLEKSRATDVKSEIKWLEAAAFGIPSVVSPTASHRRVLVDDENVLFATTPLGWQTQLARLIENPDLRIKVGQSARTFALGRFSPAVGEQILGDVIRKFWQPAVCRQKKRILLVNVFFHPQSIGGATRIVETQARGLMSLYGDDYEIYVLTTHCDPDPDRPYGVEQYWFGDVLVTRLSAPPTDWSEFEDARVGEFCQEFFRTYQFNLIHLHCIQVLTASVARAAQAEKIPYVVTLHDAWWLSRYVFLVDEFGVLVDPADPLSGGVTLTEQEIDKQIKRAKHMRDVLKRASAVLAVSEKFAELYRNAGITNTRVHENSIEPFKPVVNHRQPHDKIILGFVGGMSKHKGYHLFRQVLETGGFSEFKALVVDHSLQAGESYHLQFGETPVEFIAKVKQHEIAGLYARMDVLVAPSIWPESYGMVTREAIQAGLWVIASDRGAIGDCVVDGINGNVISVNDHRPLHDAFASLASSLASFRALAPSDRVKAQTIDTKRYIKDLSAVYEEIIL